jgi:predicted N-acetyltransferase YhbS
MPTSIRSEQTVDHAAIAAVQRAAFERDAEANLVSALRHDGLMLVSLVALHGESIVGHVMFRFFASLTRSLTTLVGERLWDSNFLRER